MKLLTRDKFREGTLSRLGGSCCVPECVSPAVDAHHILNRNLFTEPHEEGGYFLENGAGLCSEHHWDAERTLISVASLRDFCGIDSPAVPGKLDSEVDYDCWGNTIVDEYTRTPGAMFDNEGCRKALKAGNVLWQFGYNV